MLHRIKETVSAALVALLFVVYFLGIGALVAVAFWIDYNAPSPLVSFMNTTLTRVLVGALV